MIEPRIYRAAFLPAVFALILTMFSLETRPRPLAQGLAADVLFEGRLAAESLREIVERTPDRRAGSAGDRAVAERVRRGFRTQGFETTTTRFEEEGRDLVNVVGTRPGKLDRTIVVMAGRDALGVPDATGSAADTAALIELARVFEGRALRKTLVLASVDGSTLGGAGARQFAETFDDPELIDAVLVVSNSAAASASGPMLVEWSNDGTRVNVGLERTAASALRAELDDLPPQEGLGAQVARLAFPIGVGDQGVLLEQGLDALRISGSGEVAPPPERRGLEDISTERYGDVGRGTLRAVSSLEAGGRPEHGPESYVTLSGNLLPAWTVLFLAITLILPALIASVDALARARRRRQPVARWLVWLASGILPFVVGLALAEGLVLVGLADDAPRAPLDPSEASLDAGAISAVAAVALLGALVWVLGRSRVLRRTTPLPDASSPGAGTVVALAASVAAVVVWAANPFAALVLAPAVHLTLLAMLTEVRARLAAAMIAVGLVPPLAVAAYYLDRLGLNPLEGAWYLFLLVTGHHAGLATALVCCVLFGSLGCAIAVVFARARAGGAAEERRETRRREQPRVFGPGGHAGPGALGGTESTTARR